MLVSLEKEEAAMLMSPANPPGIELYSFQKISKYVKNFRKIPKYPKIF